MELRVGEDETGVKWRLLCDPPETPNRWFYWECKDPGPDTRWVGGLSGTAEWLGLSPSQCASAYLKKPLK